MISNSFSNNTDITSKNKILSIKNCLIEKIYKLTYITGNKAVSRKLLTYICLLVTFLNIVGIILHKLNFEGILSVFLNDAISILNTSKFLYNQYRIYEITVLCLFTKNIVYIISYIIILIFINKSDNNTGTLISYLIYTIYYLNVINFWIVFSIEFELNLLGLTKSTLNNNKTLELTVNNKSINNTYINNEFSTTLNIINYFNILFTLLISFNYSLFFGKYEINLIEEDYLARIDTKYEVYLLITKVIFSINFITFNYFEDNYNINIYNCINLLLALITIYNTIFNCHFYQPCINVLLIYLCVVIIFTNIMVFFVANYSSGNKCDFLIIIGFLLLYPISNYSYFFMSKYFITKIPFVEIKNAYSLCLFMARLIYLTCSENKIKKEMAVQIIGVIKQHENNCVYERCICKKEDGFICYISKNNSYVSKNYKQFCFKSSKNYILLLIKNIFEFLLAVSRNNNQSLMLMYTHFIFEYIGNYYLSLELLLSLKNDTKLSIQQKISLYRTFQMIFNKIENINNKKTIKNKHINRNINSDLNYNIKKISNTNNNYKDTIETSNINKDYYKIDFKIIIHFYEKIHFFKESIKSSVETAISFWNSILHKLDILRIKQNGLDFHYYHNFVENTYNDINLIYNELEDITIHYNLYKKYVFGDINSCYYKTKDNFINKQLSSNNSINYIESRKIFNSKSTLIIVSISDKNKAIIEKISENILDFLGYKPSECVGQDVKLIMPNFYKLRHSNFILKHYDSGINRIINTEVELYGLHSNGFTVPLYIVTKLLPSLESSVKYSSLLRERLLDYDFIITNNQGKIEMVNKNIVEKLNLNILLINSVDYYYIHYICKEYIKELCKLQNCKNILLTSHTKNKNNNKNNNNNNTIKSIDSNYGDINYFNTAYTLSNFVEKYKNNYKYTLLQFMLDPDVDIIIKDTKKNENIANNINNNPITRIEQKKDSILKNFKSCSNVVYYYSIMEFIEASFEESLILFKLYSSICDDYTINYTEVREIESILYKNPSKILPKEKLNINKITKESNIYYSCSSATNTTNTENSDNITYHKISERNNESNIGSSKGSSTNEKNYQINSNSSLYEINKTLNNSIKKQYEEIKLYSNIDNKNNNKLDLGKIIYILFVCLML